MKNKEINAGQVWKQFEDVLAPRLQMPVIDRAVYLYLLRHSRLEGKVRLRFSILSVAEHIGLSEGTVRDSVRRLTGQGVLRLVERNKSGHVAEVRVPEEIGVVQAVEPVAGTPQTVKARAALARVDGLAQAAGLQPAPAVYASEPKKPAAL
jgi:predicted transcriptional regulator